jgi:hypothetical protein
MYSPDDMQLFHHYLIAAYPSIPHNFEEVWINDVPTQSHEVSIALTPSDFQSLTDQYSYLMNAMLALAGSHLAVQVENPKTKLALHHWARERLHKMAADGQRGSRHARNIVSVVLPIELHGGRVHGALFIPPRLFTAFSTHH